MRVKEKSEKAGLKLNIKKVCVVLIFQLYAHWFWVLYSLGLPGNSWS